MTLTENHLALALRAVPVALAIVGIFLTTSYPRSALGLGGVAAVLVGAYAHGRLTERVVRGGRRWEEEGPPILVPRAAAQALAGYRHVGAHFGYLRKDEEKARIRAHLGTGAPMSWCPCCGAIHCSALGLNEDHDADCARNKAQGTLDALLGDE